MGDGATTNRVVFMGSCPFALSILQAVAERFSVVGVFTAPPKPKGRGHTICQTCVHDYADSLGIPVFTPSTFRHDDGVNDLKALNPDVVVVASYGLLLPQRVLDIPVWGCVNVHPSLLPRWRGASPLVQPLLAGDDETGVAIMVMDAGMDTGPVLRQTRVPIPPRTTIATLTQILAQQGANVLCNVLPDYLSGCLKPVPQSSEGVTYAPKITKDMGRLDWSDSAWMLLRKIDAFQPWPGTWGMIGGQKISIIQADASIVNDGDSGAHPREDRVRNDGDKFGLASGGCVSPTIVPWGKSWAIVCGQHSVLIPKQVRSSNGKTMDAEAFLRGHRDDLFP